LASELVAAGKEADILATHNISVYIEKSQEIFLRFKIIEKYQQMKI